jgi:hypothetical protein
MHVTNQPKDAKWVPSGFGGEWTESGSTLCWGAGGVCLQRGGIVVHSGDRQRRANEPNRA